MTAVLYYVTIGIHWRINRVMCQIHAWHFFNKYFMKYCMFGVGILV